MGVEVEFQVGTEHGVVPFGEHQRAKTNVDNYQSLAHPYPPHDLRVSLFHSYCPVDVQSQLSQVERLGHLEN